MQHLQAETNSASVKALTPKTESNQLALSFFIHQMTHKEENAMLPSCQLFDASTLLPPQQCSTTSTTTTTTSI